MGNIQGDCLELQRGQVRKIDGENEKVRKRKIGYVNKNTCKTNYRPLKLIIKDPVGTMKLKDLYVMLVIPDYLVKIPQYLIEERQEVYKIIVNAMWVILNVWSCSEDRCFKEPIKK